MTKKEFFQLNPGQLVIYRKAGVVESPVLITAKIRQRTGVNTIQRDFAAMRGIEYLQDGIIKTHWWHDLFDWGCYQLEICAKPE